MVFSFIARGIRTLQRWPRFVLVSAGIISLLLLLPIANMNWKTGLSNLLPSDIPSRQVEDQLEEKFGGFGTLTVVVHSPDSAANSKVVAELSRQFEQSDLVNFTEYRTEADFYLKHQFLYIRLQDLIKIRDRVQSRLDQIKIQQNPFIVNLDTIAEEDTSDTPLSLADLEEKYLSSLRPYLGNEDGTIQVLEVYPSKSVNNLSKNRALVKLAESLVKKHPLKKKVQIHYTGKVYEYATTGGTLLREVYRIGWISAGIIILFLTLWFFRQPQIPLIGAIPIGMAMIWTLGFNALFYDSMNFFTLILCLIIPGMGAIHLTHFLSHYIDERRRGLGPDLALESTVLGTGPVITVVSGASAIAFFSLILLPLDGLSQLGIVGGFGVLVNWASVVLFLPTLLTILQRRQMFRVLGHRKPEIDREKSEPYPDWKRILPVLSVVTVILASQGIFPSFDYDFSKLEYQKPSSIANALLLQSGIPAQEPAVVLTKNAEESRHLAEALQRQAPADSLRTIQRVVSFASLLPIDQEKKLDLLREIRAMLTPDIIATLKGTDSVTIRRIMNNWDTTPLTEDDLPASYRRKFIGRNSTVGEFTFIFPSINTDDGRECRRFARDVRAIQISDSVTVYSTGTAIIRADLLDHTLPWMSRTILVAIVGIILLVLLYERRLYRAIFVILPPAIGFLWLLSLMNLLDIPMNPYSAQVFPMLIGLAISGSHHLWHQYREKSTGSVGAILRHVGPIVGAATLTSMVCFSGLLFSSHPGLHSMGLVAVLGLLCLLLAQLTMFPVLVGWLDWRRYQLQKSK